MIAENLAAIKKTIPENVTLVAVSKTYPVENILEAYIAGQRIFGENKVQEMADKYPELPKDIEWHLIGHLQSNKVKYIAPFVSLIHSVDSLKLLQEIDKQASKNNRIIDCLLQFHIAKEESKFGLNIHEAENILNSHELKSMKNIRIVGVMGMASFTQDQTIIQTEFKTLKTIFDSLKSNHFANNNAFRIISMGMSGDYELAVQNGSTMVRIGSSIFGKR